MSHAFVDELFRALAEHALGSAVTSTLPLHGGRIFLAVALRARGYSYSADMTKAICRWKTDASAVLYPRLLQDEHAAAVDLAIEAKITPTLITTTRRDCVLDNDHCVQRAGGARDARVKMALRAASPSGPPIRTAADHRDDAGASSGSDDDSDGEADGVVVAGPPVDADTIGPGDAVAVRFNSRGGSVKAYSGVVVKPMARIVRVKFRGCAGYETFDVKTERVLTAHGRLVALAVRAPAAARPRLSDRRSARALPLGRAPLPLWPRDGGLRPAGSSGALGRWLGGSALPPWRL